MDITILLLLLPITGNSSPNGPKGALRAVLNTLTEILQLPLSLLLLAGSILLNARTAQTLVADHVTQGLLGRADGLVPRAGGAVGVIFGGCAGVGVCGDGAQLGGGVGGIVLGFGLGLGCFALVLGLLVLGWV